MREATCSKRFVSPLGRPVRPYAVTCEAADRPRLFGLNRYPRQIIGVTLRLPSGRHISGRLQHYYISLVWAKPARWWA